MDAGIKETKEQALKEMELFKTVFDGVRLLNMHASELIGKGLGSYSLTESEQKFDFWEKEHPCTVVHGNRRNVSAVSHAASHQSYSYHPSV